MPYEDMRLRRATVMPEAVRRLYLESFPAEERRPLHQLERLIADPGSGVTLLLLDDGASAVPAGFMTLWSLAGGLCYIEHFATRPELRGAGLGARAVALLAGLTAGAPVVIEVERPADGGMARRRIAFYERCGFTLHDGYIYVQPPYSRGLGEVEMRLMTLGDLSGVSIDDVAATLKRRVYRANPDNTPCDGC